MAELQTSYTDQIAPAVPGMVANGETSNRISRTIEDSAGVGFGKAVFRGTGENGCTATPTAGQLLGITIAASVLALTAGATADTYPQYEGVNILALGAIWVTAGATVAKGDQAYVTSGGAITNSSSGNTILPGWFFDHAASSAALVRLVRR